MAALGSHEKASRERFIRSFMATSVGFYALCNRAMIPCPKHPEAEPLDVETIYAASRRLEELIDKGLAYEEQEC